MVDNLYMERWLLTVKAAAMEAGLETHVRALDRKGGQLLALEVRQGPEALELRYRKRRLGPRIVAAATGAPIVGPVRAVLQKLLADHRKLLENGFRRFLRKSLEVVEAVAAAFARDSGLQGRVQTALGAHANGLRPAVVVQPDKRGKFQTLPAVARSRGSSFNYYAWNANRLLDLTYLFPGNLGAKGSLPALSAAAGAVSLNSLNMKQSIGGPAGPEIGGGDWGSAADGAPANISAEGKADGSPMAGLTEAGNALGGLAGDGSALDGLAEAGGALGAMTEAGGNAAEAVAAGVDLAAAAEVLGAVADVVTTDATVEVVASAASCLGDAACSGIDLGGLDCNLG